MASEFADIAEHTVTCPVCFEFFVDTHVPKDLVCPHACCLVCLQWIAILNEPRRAIACPLCKQKTPIPRGVAALKTNLHLKNLAEHHPNYATRHRHSVPRCAHHGEKTHLYCQPCNKLACQSCVFAFHQGANHSSRDVKTTSKKWKQELNPVLDHAKTEIEACEESAQSLKNLKREINEHLESEKQQVDQFVEELIAKVKREREDIKNELQKATEIKLARIDEEVDRLEKQAKKLKAANEVATQTVASSDYAYITQHAILVDKMKKLAVKEEATYISQTPQAAKFIQRNMPDVKLLGRVVIPRELKLVQEIGAYTDATSLAYCPDGLLAVSDDGDNRVTFYRKRNGQYEKQKRMLLAGLAAPISCGLAGCADGKFLVARYSGIEVYSRRGKPLYHIEITDYEHVRSNYYAGSVLTMADGRILAGDVFSCVITKHEPTGNIIQTMKTNIPPNRMTLIHDTHIAMSDFESGKVSVIDMASQQETRSIDIPKVDGICYDERTDCLLTVRSEPADEPEEVLLNTGVIEQYCCTTGGLVACLAQGLYQPRDMVLIPDGHLAAADMKSVKIYKII